METLIHYFETIPSLHRALILAGGLTFFWLIESVIPLFKFKYKKSRHALTNIFLTITTLLINLPFAFVIVLTADYFSEHHIGLLYVFNLPVIIFIFAGLLLLDFIGAYIIHVIQHKVKWMWKFHIVHHSDMHVDTTTANRHHPIESIFRAVFTLLAVIISGAPMWLVMMYQSASVVFSQFNHANITLPRWLDNAISWLIVSPNMHKVHHHYLQPLTDTNYGNIFSIWDRLFKTFASVEKPNENLQYGIDLLMQEKDSQQIGNLLTMPFKKYEPLPTSKFVDSKKYK
ncbi:MAG: sterol desaturase family protein [Chitinophagales bacterium]|nr:sterol desaturase family protein [Chitinophagales bacterium]MBP9549795.1 sterol desaturase family protein [Chitinophagales bacterium]MBP9704072.1 sterol desaturase family protein [Chitinophagales bacterium]